MFSSSSPSTSSSVPIETTSITVQPNGSTMNATNLTSSMVNTSNFTVATNDNNLNGTAPSEPHQVVFHIPPSFIEAQDTSTSSVELGTLPTATNLSSVSSSSTPSPYPGAPSEFLSAPSDGHTNKDVTLLIPSATPSPTEAINANFTSPYAEEFLRLVDPSVKEDPIEKMVNWDDEKQDAFVQFVHVQQLLGLMMKIDGIGSDTLSFSKLSYTHNGIRYLDDVSGVVKPKTVVAAIGAPDAGVSLFLSLLAGRVPRDGKMQGRVLFNGRDRRPADTRSIGYVVKEDPNLPELTVYETLFFSAKTRLQEVTDRAARLRTLMIMKLLGLSHTVNTIVGDAITRGVSGGERRRVCFGCEFIAGSRVTVADLPTNGLDSTSAYNLIKNIKTLTAAGRSMICSIVQPSPELFALFDTVLVLSKGKIFYQGPPSEVEAYFAALGFKKPNMKALPDFIEELSGTPEKYWTGAPPPKPLSKSSAETSSSQLTQTWLHALLPGKKKTTFIAPQKTVRGSAWLELSKAYAASPMKSTAEQAVEESIKNPGGAIQGGFRSAHYKHGESHGRYALNGLEQFLQLFRRQALLTFRNPQLWAQNIQSAIVIGLILGSLFWNIGHSQADVRTPFGLFFFVMMNAAMAPSQMIPVHFQQRSAFYNQILNGYYHPAAYYFAAFTVQLPVALLETFILTIIVYGMSNLYDGISTYWLYLWLLIFLINSLSRAFIMFIVSLSKNETVAQVLHPLTMLLFFTMAGFLAPFNSIPKGWSWVYYISYLSYGIRGLAINHFKHDDFVFQCPTDGTGCGWKTGADALEIYDMNGDLSERWTDIQNLVWFFIGWMVGGSFMYTVWVWTDGELEEPPNFHDVEVVHIDKQLSHAALLQLSNKAYIEWSNLDYEVDVKDDKTGKMKPRKLLSNTFGFSKPGIMVALMGASGAGKSTLLDVLAMKKTAGRIKGKILVNGLPQEPVSFSRMAAYVEQFDSHDEKCTVREAILFSARLRLPANTSEDQLNNKVNNVMAVLNISHLQDERIGNADTGGVSPEVRKKCTIAVELIMEPSILFLDEPTTGLDAPGALSVMTAVRELASEIGVVCTIHQPSSEIVNMFDYLLLMKEGGEIAYFGPLRDVATYFGDSQLGHYMPGANIGDFALHYIKHTISTGTNLLGEPVNLAENFLASRWGQEGQRQLEAGVVPIEMRGKLTVPPESAFPNPWTQFGELLRRFVLSTYRDVPGLMARMVTAILQGFVVGTLYIQLGDGQTDAQNRVSISFMVTLMECFSATVRQPAIIAARPVYFREKGSNMYTVMSYHLARIFGDWPFAFVEVTIFVLLVYFPTGMTLESSGSHFWLFYLCVWLIRLMALAYNTLTSSLVGNPAGATAMFTLTLVILMLYTGFLIPHNSIPNGWIWMYYLSFLRYPVNFIASNELRNKAAFTCSTGMYNVSALYSACDVPTFYNGTNFTNPFKTKCQVQCGPELLDQFGLGYSNSDMYVNIFVVLIFVLAFNYFGFLALRNINHIKR